MLLLLVNDRVWNGAEGDQQWIELRGRESLKTGSTRTSKSTFATDLISQPKLSKRADLEEWVYAAVASVLSKPSQVNLSLKATTGCLQNQIMKF